MHSMHMYSNENKRAPNKEFTCIQHICILRKTNRPLQSIYQIARSLEPFYRQLFRSRLASQKHEGNGFPFPFLDENYVWQEFGGKGSSAPFFPSNFRAMKFEGGFLRRASIASLPVLSLRLLTSIWSPRTCRKFNHTTIEKLIRPVLLLSLPHYNFFLFLCGFVKHRLRKTRRK